MTDKPLKIGEPEFLFNNGTFWKIKSTTPISSGAIICTLEEMKIYLNTEIQRVERLRENVNKLEALWRQS